MSMILGTLGRLTIDGWLPMHMPGHKRSTFPDGILPYDLDATEVEGLDDLHHARGMLKDAMDRAAGLYGAARSYYLVNGATCGILAAVGALTHHNGHLIAARNSHISVFHAIQVMDLKAHLVMPPFIENCGIFGSLDPQEILNAVRSTPDGTPVIITSPTYEGVISDIRSIASICHEHGRMLIVDEAHGAHLSLYSPKYDHVISGSGDTAVPGTGERGYNAETDGRGMETPAVEGYKRTVASLAPAEALNAGADIVIQSPHKTLLSLTQTALLHLGRSALQYEDRIEEELSIYETSSPSYLLMASLDSCTDLLTETKDKRFEEFYGNLKEFYEGVRDLKTLWVPGFECDDTGIYLRDPGKILINTKRSGMTGRELAELMRQDYRVETEMSHGYNVLAMATIGDIRAGLIRLRDVLIDLDRRIQIALDIMAADGALKDAERSAQVTPVQAAGADREQAPWKAENGAEDPVQAAMKTLLDRHDPDMNITEAAESRQKVIPIDEAVGERSGEYVYIYPPGVPFILPGETITEEMVGFLAEIDGTYESEDQERCPGVNLVRSRTGDRQGMLTVVDR